jgi:hypothetical protein
MGFQETTQVTQTKTKNKLKRLFSGKWKNSQKFPFCGRGCS